MAGAEDTRESRVQIPSGPPLNTPIIINTCPPVLSNPDNCPMVVDIKKEIILNHELVPKHEILSEEEAQELLEKPGISKKQLPRIYVSDPVAKILGAKPGDVIKITRKSPTAGESIYYRVVVKG